MRTAAPFTTVLVAPDSFKGTMSATAVAEAIARGLEAEGWPVDRCPVADGGEGTAAALLAALGGEERTARARDPLGREGDFGWALLSDGRAVVEVASATGLALLAEEERDPERASSAGTGDLIAATAAAGATEILVAAGGSATVDGGQGMLEALEEHGGLGVPVVVLVDVTTPWERAAAVFGPQKGASPEAVPRLEARLDAYAAALPKDPRGVAATGAAGGISGALWATYGARLEPGAAAVLKAVGFDARLREARAVVVGEGRMDAQTLLGKIAGEIAVRARQGGVPCHAVVGRDELDPLDARILDLQQILEAGDPEALEAAGRELARLI